MALFISFLSFFISFSAFALESSDVMNTQILKAYNKNVLVLNRGIEDAIYKNDHIKLTNQNGFIARGICIKTTMLTSHFKIYRVVRPELVSKDSLYQMRSINQSEMPRDIARFQKVDFSKYFSDYDDRKVKKQLRLQNKRIAKYDLPQSVKDTEFYYKKTRSKFDTFIEENFKNEDIKNDLSETYFEIFASPYTFETLYDQRESHYGARLYNKGNKYQYELSALERQRRLINPFNQNEIYNTKATHYRFDFQLNRITENWSIITFLKYDREKFGRIYYPHRFYRGAIFGFKYHIYEDNPKTDFFEISYAPALDLIEYNDLETLSSDSLRERQGYRHTVQMRLHSTLSDDWSMRFNLYYAPFTQDLFGDMDWGDNMLNVENTFSHNLGKEFFLDYTLAYMRDELRAETYNIRADNAINTVRLRYEFDL